MAQNRTGKWDFWIDRGGTFTDVVARKPDGEIHAHKLLSENPESYADAGLQGIRDLMGIAGDGTIPADQINAVKMGTTVATNALLERKGDRTLLVITEGLRDQLAIGYQARPKLFDLNIKLPDMLYERVVEAPERVTADGQIDKPLDLETTITGMQAAFDDGIRAVAIAFMHGYRYHDHEIKVAKAAEDIGFTQISVSHLVSPLIKLVGRGDTAVVDAYLSPILRRYVDQVAAELDAEKSGCRLMFMQSSGGLTAADLFQGKDAILSGPAGGVVGAVETSAFAGFDKIIGFDMGGTSTDVSHYNGELERAFETEVAGVRMRAPMMLIHTVAAGGGSILHFDGARYRVGPDSAGANPGPKCYRRGGPLTVTDANLMLGKINPDFFPHIFGPTADEPLDDAATKAAFADLAIDIDDGRKPEDVAEGFLKIAVENMANAIKKVSVQRGYDVTQYVLTCFGGAGGQHACLVADALGMEKVLLHPLAGILSAYGMGLADIRANRQRALEVPLDDAAIAAINDAAAELGAETSSELHAQGITGKGVVTHVRAHLRYAGTDTAIGIDADDPDVATLKSAFDRDHKQRFGFISDEKQIVVEALEVESSGGGAKAVEHDQPTTDEVPAARAQTRFYSGGAWHDAPVYDRDALLPGQRVAGPAVIAEPHGTVIVEDEWAAEMSPKRHLVLARTKPAARQMAIGTSVDPVMLEVFNNLFMSIAEQMGVTLQNTSYSVNIKERLDFSCAIFKQDGSLIANAPHMPVHLGSMDRSVQTIAELNEGRIRPGDVFMLNAPYNGGTHLPDITVVTPVFDKARKEILFWVASRGHHADIGGMAPGSATPRATVVEEEGVYIDNFLLVDTEGFREAETYALLTGAKYPARSPDHNIADLKAQVAANEKGVQELRNMIEHFSLPVVTAYMGHVQDNAEESVRRVIGALSDCAFEIRTDQDALIKVKITVDKKARTAKIDFTGSSPQMANNFNAPRPISRAAVLYVFRCMVADEIPMNAGCLRPIEIIVPDNSILSPEYPAAVIAGNVETSQIVTDCLFGALGALSSAQGTMNNLTFGNDEYQYYETICSGAPAGPGFSGASGVHTHMTNSRLTDPEVLEQRFPVLLEKFEIRRGSGGKGKWNAGDGTYRRLRFRKKMDCAIISGFRTVAPFGLAGGEPGQCGKNAVRRNDGTIEPLQGCDQTVLDAGEAIIVETPTGGGYGKAEAE